jgi:hypothetical protein
MIIPSAGASGTTAAKGRASSSSSSIVCVVLCAVLSCLVMYRSYGTRHLRGSSRERQTDKDSGRSKKHSSACDKWDVYGQWNACPVRCFWCCIARPVAAPSLAHERPAAPAVQSSRLCNRLISKAAGGLSQRPLHFLMHQRRPGWQVLDAAAPFA